MRGSGTEVREGARPRVQDLPGRSCTPQQSSAPRLWRACAWNRSPEQREPPGRVGGPATRTAHEQSRVRGPRFRQAEGSWWDLVVVELLRVVLVQRIVCKVHVRLRRAPVRPLARGGRAPREPKAYARGAPQAQTSGSWEKRGRGEGGVSPGRGSACWAQHTFGCRSVRAPRGAGSSVAGRPAPPAGALSEGGGREIFEWRRESARRHAGARNLCVAGTV